MPTARPTFTTASSLTVLTLAPLSCCGCFTEVKSRLTTSHALCFSADFRRCAANCNQSTRCVEFHAAIDATIPALHFADEALPFGTQTPPFGAAHAQQFSNRLKRLVTISTLKTHHLPKDLHISSASRVP